MSKENEKKKKTGRKPTGLLGEKKSFYIKPSKLLELLAKEARANRRSISEWLSMILEERYKEELEKGKENDEEKS